VGLALGLFVVSDALNTNYRIFGGPSTDVGVINGDRISIKQFEEKLESTIEQYKKRSPNTPIDDNLRGQIREQIWNQYINDHLMSKEFADLGIEVSNEELEDMLFGNNIHPQIKQAFTDPKTGMFDKNAVVRYIRQLDEATDESVKKQWKDFEDYLVIETMTRKYTNLLKKGVYFTKVDAANANDARNKSYEINFVGLAYSSIADSTIKPEESDLKAWFRKNSEKYKERENSRKVDFVVWDFAPTAEDSAVIRKWAYDQVEQFRSAKNDTVYVDANSDTKFDTTARPRTAYPEEVADQLFRDSVGTVVGPIFKDGKYKLFKIAGIKQDTIYYMHASHILFKVDGPTQQDTLNSKKKAEEVLAKIRKGESFAAMASQYGTDGTKDRGGDLGWFAEGQMVKEFNDAVKAHQKGDMYIVKTQFGYHIVKVTDDKTRKLVCAGVLERTVEPSESTLNKAYNEASQFAAATTNEEEFDKNVQERKLEKRTADFVKEQDAYLPGLSDAREVVRWAFNAKKGDVSEVYTISNNKYAIACVRLIREKNKATFESAKDRVTADYIKDKKGEQLTEKMKTSAEGATTLEAVSKKLNQPINPVPSFTFENPSVPYTGFDPTFGGVVAGTTALNKLVMPVKGDAGVYAFVTTKITNAPEIKDYTPLKNELANGLQSRLEYGYMDVLKEMKGVEDNRYRFY
jgi:peptidyl-prolyl cis-trans isomerase D